MPISAKKKKSLQESAVHDSHPLCPYQKNLSETNLILHLKYPSAHLSIHGILYPKMNR